MGDDAGDDAELLPIGVFARAVEVTTSALRFYDDSGLLRPAFVDPVSGYRWYAPGQKSRAVLLRRLRLAGIPLAETLAVLDGDQVVARRVLAAHLDAAEAQLAGTRREVDELLGALPGYFPCSTTPEAAARVEAGELRAAVAQVVPAAGVHDADPALRCVLVEIGTDEVRLVATDRYRLAVRVLKATDTRRSAAVLLDPGVLVECAGWVDIGGTVELEMTPSQVVVRADGGRRVLPTEVGAYPHYRQILSALPAPVTRCTVSRTGFLGAFRDIAGPVVLTIGDGRLTVATAGRSIREPQVPALPALVSGPGMRVVFALEVLVPAVTASVGPDVLLEIAAPDRAVVVRSADEGSYTTLAMPTGEPVDLAATRDR